MLPHLTHLLQPLDVAVFQPLKHYQAKALDTIIRDGCAYITKLEFLAYIQQIRTQAFKESTVKSAFKKTGIHPFNPQVVLQETADRMPQYTPSPPSHQLNSSIFSTSVTLRHAEKMRNDILLFLDENPGFDPDFSHAVAKFINEFVINTAELVQIKRDLVSRRAARVSLPVYPARLSWYIYCESSAKPSALCTT
jgi:hypothetical protein